MKILVIGFNIKAALDYIGENNLKNAKHISTKESYYGYDPFKIIVHRLDGFWENKFYEDFYLWANLRKVKIIDIDAENK